MEGFHRQAQTWPCLWVYQPTSPCPTISPKDMLKATSQIVDTEQLVFKAEHLMTDYKDIGGQRANSYHILCMTQS